MALPIRSMLDRFPRTKHAVHASVTGGVRAAARAGLDLNRLRVRVGDAGIPQSTRLRLIGLTPPRVVHVRPPAAAFDLELGAISDMCARVARGYTRPPSGVLEIQEGRFQLPSGMVAVDRRLPSELIPLMYFPHAFVVLPTLQALFARAKEVPDGILINLAMSNSYYHWTCEILPRALRAVAALPARLPLYISDSLPHFVYEFLALAELDDRCVRLPAGVYSAERLAVPTFERAEWPAPEDLRMVRDLMGNAIRPAGQDRRNLLISRRQAVGRRVLNEDQLLRALADLDLEPVILEDMGVEEQVRLFQTAGSVVAPHGAGLTNIVFAPRGCRVVELAVDSHHSPSYQIIASLLGHPYGYIRCEQRRRDLLVDPSAVRVVLDQLNPVATLRAEDGHGSSAC